MGRMIDTHSEMSCVHVRLGQVCQRGLADTMKGFDAEVWNGSENRSWSRGRTRMYPDTRPVA